MMTLTDTTPRQAAVITGIAMLVMLIAAVIATDIVLGTLIVANDAAATTRNITAGNSLFRGGIVNWIAILICDVFVAWGLYVFLKPLNPGLSLLIAWFRLAYVAILGSAISHLVTVTQLVSGAAYLQGLEPEQLNAMVMLSLDDFSNTWSAGLAVFGVHMLLLGILAMKSTEIPKLLSLLLLIAAFGYLLTNLLNLMLPDYSSYKTLVESVFLIPMVVGEVGLGIWLLVKGGKSKG